jgi:CBS domain-containing protein
MLVEEVMNQHVITVHEQMTLREVFMLIHEHRLGNFVVVDTESRYRGMLFERNLMELVYGDIERQHHGLVNYAALQDIQPSIGQTPVLDVTNKLVQPVRDNDSVFKAGAVMLFEKLNALPVMDADGKIVGVVEQNKIFMAIGDLLCKKFFRDGAKREVRPENEADEDKRFFRRVPLEILVAYKLVKDPAGKPAEHEAKIAKSVDVSAGGFFILTQEALPAGALVDTAFDIYRNHQPIRSMCRVVRCVHHQDLPYYKVGLMFLAMELSERKQMNDYLESGPVQPDGAA